MPRTPIARSTACSVLNIPFVATVSGLCCAVLDAARRRFVDHRPPKRWEALVATAALLIAANALQISLGPRTWFAAGLIQATVGAGELYGAPGLPVCVHSGNGGRPERGAERHGRAQGPGSRPRPSYTWL